MEKIIIYKEDDMWVIEQGDKKADNMTFEEMLGILVTLTGLNENLNKFLNWMEPK